MTKQKGKRRGPIGLWLEVCRADPGLALLVLHFAFLAMTVAGLLNISRLDLDF